MNFLEILASINQFHLIKAYQTSNLENKHLLLKQIEELDLSYPGGLKQYYLKTKRLLLEEIENKSRYEDYQVSIPRGISLGYNDLNLIEKFQAIGKQQIEFTVFILVAGGLGERLKYPGSKLMVPMELILSKSFLNYYADYIVALQKKYCSKQISIPLVIMTSKETYIIIEDILTKNKYFGLQQSQVTILKQEQVPSMNNIEGEFVLVQGKLQIQTKPHGHGDIHSLIHQKQLASKWKKQGKKWAIFFQDTKAITFRYFISLLGISATKDYDFNSVAVPRKPNEPIGAIVSLKNKQSNKNLTINVEYNQLKNLFKGNEEVDENGFSLYPGNHNCFIIKINTYETTLKKTKGLIPQFINPKYTDQSKTQFKTSTRLQCMMQDYPLLLNNCDKVGFTMINYGYYSSSAKNSPQSAIEKFKAGLRPQSIGSYQADLSRVNRDLLRAYGADIPENTPIELGQLTLNLYPTVYISPQFATSFTQVKNKLKRLKISQKSSLVLNSDCILEDVEIDGTAILKQQGPIKIKINNKNYQKFIPTIGNQSPQFLIRRFKIQQKKITY